MVKCVFCGREEDEFKGTFLFKNDGSTHYYCSSKCRKNQIKLKRDKRKVRWTESFHLVREKKIAKDKEKAEVAKAKMAAK